MHQNNPEIHRIDKLLSDYAEKAKVNVDAEKMKTLDGKKLLTIITRDYQKGIISIDDFSSLCELMYGKFDPLSDLYGLLLLGAEIKWYMRWDPERGAGFIRDLVNQFGIEWTESKTGSYS